MSFFRDVFREGEPAAGERLAGHPSVALGEMARLLSSVARPHLLDLGPVCDRNIEYFASRGCRVFVEAAEDLRRTPRRPPAKASAGNGGKGNGNGNGRDGASAEPPAAAPLVLSYPEAHFDGILLWDVVDYLEEEKARELGAELHRISRPGALLALYSDARRGAGAEPLLRFRLAGDGRLATDAVPGLPLTRIRRENRDLLRLFPRHDVVKSTLLPGQLREMLLRRNS